MRYTLPPFIFTLLILSSCTPGVESSGRDFLVRCWNAVKTDPSGSEYELSFEAILIPTDIPSIFSWSPTCPEARLGLDYMPPRMELQVARISHSIRFSAPGVGLRGRVRVIPVRKTTPYFLSVRATSWSSLEEMTPEETQAYVAHYHVVW